MLNLKLTKKYIRKFFGKYHLKGDNCIMFLHTEVIIRCI